MPINPGLLISAPMLQNYFVDKTTGLPLAGGKIDFWTDQNRIQRKNVYSLSGSPGAPTYVVLPNPITLSAVGTVQDANLNDVIPYYYPYNENTGESQPYFVDVSDADGVHQYTRFNFPNNPQDPTPTTTLPTLQNLIVNSGFWQNIGSQNLTSNQEIKICRGASHGFAFPDISAQREINAGSDTISFNPIPAGEFLQTSTYPNQNVTPYYNFRWQCTASAAMTYKRIRFPIANKLKMLEGTSLIFSVFAKNGIGNVNNEIKMSLLQYCGSGVTSPAAVVQSVYNVPGNTWNEFRFQFIVPAITGLTLSQANDDGLYIFLEFPSSVAFDLYIAKPTLYVGLDPSTDMPTNEFCSYSDIYPILSSPRTGEKRISIDNFVLPDEILLDDGTIGNSASGATNRANQDTWFLYNMLWQQYQTLTPAQRTLYYSLYATGAYGTVAAYGASAYADFIAGKQLQLPKTLARVSAGTVGNIALAFTVAFGTSNTLLTLASAKNIPTGTPVYLSGSGTPPTGLEFGVVYYAIWVSSTQIRLSYSPDGAYTNNVATYLVFTSNGSGTFQLNTGYQALIPFGEGRHKQTLSELATHAHTPASGSFVITGGSQGGGSGAWTATALTSSAGASYPFNVVQPTIFEYHFMRL